MQVASFTQPASDAEIVVAYTAGGLTASGKAVRFPLSSILLIVGGGYYILEDQTPTTPTSDTGFVVLRNWASASTINALPNSTVPAGTAYSTTAFTDGQPNKGPNDGNGTVIVSRAPSAIVPGVSSPPTDKTTLYAIKQIDLAAFTMPATGSTVMVNILDIDPRTTWQSHFGTENPLTPDNIATGSFVRTSAGLMQIQSFSIGSPFTPDNIVLKNMGTPWNRGPGFSATAAPVWNTFPATGTISTLLSSDNYMIRWNNATFGKVYLPWGINPDLGF